ncbi:hypothetical protein Aeqsu_2903 [Aequorivita sublithincola DSM 14238]|uniref:Capsule assembly protein Wzi n=1 Tax=Aequorivita sublithincola (strain DSM 14238 / LMG 21431 / ACAM 643 / 9-3) TaxID=746697 RepID=I3YZC6_AEQSU|nr:hypothetical protein Aeqsu_2903 [Aequorivita sublithincola DSM 14238]
MQFIGKLKTLKIIFFLFIPTLIWSQELDIKGKVEAKTILANEDENPFWFHTNTDYSVSELTNFSATAELAGSLTFSSFKINAGGAVYGRDGVEDAVQRRDLYAQFENSWLLVTVGAKKRAVLLDGLSSTNQNFLWSGNARPLPGLILEANNPFKISKTFSVDWGIAHYQLNDTRYVKNPNLHYKRLGIITNFNEKQKLTLRVQHFAQWGGTSPEIGKLKSGFKDFVNVFFAHNTEEIGVENETINKLGNHLGSLFMNYELKNKFGEFSIYHDHYIEDGSGTRFANFPDGLWGLYFKPNNQKIIASILYEYIDTVDQSGISVGSGRDNYFSNSIYRSGWTYEGNIIGIPFMLYDKNLPLSTISSRFISNRSKTHHIGIAGKLKMLEWQLKTTYTKYLGTYGRPLNPELKAYYNYGSLAYKNEKLGTFKVMGGVDFSNVSSTVVGGGIEYSYSF